MAADVEHQLVKYLTDVHSIEEQALTQMRRAPDLVEGRLAEAFRRHLDETESQEQRVRERGDAPSALKDAALRLGALNWAAFMAAQPDTPPKLAGFAFLLEHLEIGSYELLRRVAERAGDAETVTEVERTLSEERAAAGAIAAQWETVLSAAPAAESQGGPGRLSAVAELAQRLAQHLLHRRQLGRAEALAPAAGGGAAHGPARSAPGRRHALEAVAGDDLRHPLAVEPEHRAELVQVKARFLPQVLIPDQDPVLRRAALERQIGRAHV